mgnify:CR=1 FL=1
MKTTALVFDSDKAAALYFDHIIPTSLRSFVQAEDGELLHTSYGDSFYDILRELLPNELQVPKATSRNLNEIFGIEATYFSMLQQPVGAGLYALTARAGSFNLAEYTAYNERYLRGLLQLFNDDYATVGGEWTNDATAAKGETCVQLMGLQLVDASKASWEQILEVRKDAHARAKLRALRDFFEDTCLDKDKHYIMDKLEVLIDDYKQASRKHGLSLVSNSLLLLIPQLLKTLLQLAGIVENDLGALLTTTLDIGVAGITVALLSGQYDKSQLLATKPVAYISDLRKRLS